MNYNLINTVKKINFFIFIYYQKMNYYKILDIDRTNDINIIKKAYFKKSIENHPDKGGSQEKMIEINLAYENILKLLYNDKINKNINYEDFFIYLDKLLNKYYNEININEIYNLIIIVEIIGKILFMINYLNI